ncbi:MAG: 50S ribosomal protein L9 [Chloroflexi bacterium]|nr:50S ribosomal protein L9 [Chloroflexota bacterium]
MKVILTKNVPKLGEVGDVCTVKDGFGRNYLLPQGLAILATSGALKQIVDLKRTESRRQDKIRYEMMDLAKRIEDQRLEFTAKVGETGRLYGSITAANIADALEEKLGHEVDRRKITLDESLRSLGDHQVPIHLMPGVDANINVKVVADAELVADLPVEASPSEGDEPTAEMEGEEVEA